MKFCISILFKTSVTVKVSSLQILFHHNGLVMVFSTVRFSESLYYSVMCTFIGFAIWDIWRFFTGCVFINALCWRSPFCFWTLLVSFSAKCFRLILAQHPMFFRRNYKFLQILYKPLEFFSSKLVPMYSCIFRQLQQRIDQCQERSYSNRCSLLQQQILRLLDDEFGIDIENQHRLLQALNVASCEMKEAGDASKMVRYLNCLSKVQRCKRILFVFLFFLCSVALVFLVIRY